jgi:hypothetical protein
VEDPHPVFDPADPAALECYRLAIRTLSAAGVEFLVGGAYALARHAGIARHTKDLDVFVRPDDRDAALAALAGAGFATEVTYSHWLAKAKRGEHFIDLIYSSGNGVGVVDDGWFAHAVPGLVAGVPVRLCPAEEVVWHKAFIMERDRFDGADVAHVLRARGGALDWRRLLDRFGPHWRVLYVHLVLFGFVYPAERERIPAWVAEELSARLHAEAGSPAPDERECAGTLLSATQYLPDVGEWGYRDPRLAPEGPLTPQQAGEWLDGILTGR